GDHHPDHRNDDQRQQRQDHCGERAAFRDHHGADHVDPFTVRATLRCAAVDDFTDLTDRRVLLFDARTCGGTLVTCGEEIPGVDGESVAGLLGSVADRFREAAALTHRGHGLTPCRCDGHFTHLPTQLKVVIWDARKPRTVPTLPCWQPTQPCWPRTKPCWQRTG